MTEQILSDVLRKSMTTDLVMMPDGDRRSKGSDGSIDGQRDLGCERSSSYN